MLTKKKFLVLDFDQTITSWKDALTKSSADKLAKILNDLMEKHNVHVIVLSMANKAHILTTVHLSKSKPLLRIFSQIPLVTVENRRKIFEIDRSFGESVKTKNEMIEKVMGKKNILNQDPDCIRAYKKTNYLLRLSREENVPRHDIYFLDDNHYNIHFASHYNFNTYQVVNKPNTKRFQIMEYLRRIQKQLRSDKTHLKDKELRETETAIRGRKIS